MADPRRRERANAEGAWFVDTTCIACDACRQCAAQVFATLRDDRSAIARQPVDEGDVAGAARAMLACPVGAIGVDVGVAGARKPAPAALVRLLPQELDDGIWYCGYNARDSYGANAYLARTVDGGLVMVDAPRFVKPVVDAIVELGGLSAILLTHRDDVADADRYAERFGARVFIHEDDARAAPFATDTFGGTDARDTRELLPGVRAVPVPGHTKGSALFYVGGALFSGDSLAWDRDDKRMIAFRDACWYSWSTQQRSLASVVDAGAALSFEWLLPGHGQRRRASVDDNARELRALVERM